MAARSCLLSAAKARVDELKAQGHASANLYGENELGGLHVLYVLEENPGDYGLVVDPQISGTVTAWQDVIKPLGYAAVGLVALGLVINIMIARARIVSERERK